MKTSLGRRRSPTRFAGAALALLAAVALAAACSAPAPREERRSVVRGALAAFPASLSMIGKTDTASNVFARLVTDSPFQYDASLALRPRLARSYEISQDGKTVTLHLRDGVTRHDGAPVTAADVVFTVGKIRDPKTEARSYIGQFANLESIEAVDALTVRASYSAPYADVLDSWTFPVIPEHLAGRDADLLTGDFSKRPVGCGPFRLAKTEPGREIVLEANPSYWDGRPLLDRIVLEVVPDERTAYQALLRGDLSLLGVTPDTFRAAESAPEAARLKRLVYFPMSVWYIAWNQSGRNPFFTDAGVRRAMVLALDREPFIKNVLHGHGRPAALTYHPDSAWTDPAVRPWPYDPQEAARLLDAAGWRADSSGNRSKDGRRFAFTLTIAAGTQEVTDRIAAWIQQSLAKLGVTVEIAKLETKTFFERRRSREFDALMATFQLSPSPDQFELYHSSARENGMNFTGLADPEVDRLVDEGRRTLDPEARRAIYARLQARLHELEPISCLFHFAAAVLVDSRLAGVKPSPLGLWVVYPGPRQWSLGPGEPGRAGS
jgi:peptide/nickel transport system substrate-binding protein